MKKIVYALVLHLMIYPVSPQADDIDIYLPTSVSSVPLVMLMLDWRPSVFSTYCNSFNDACRELMSDSAAAALQDNRDATGTSGKVTLYEVFVAVLESIMDNGVFDSIHMGLMISNFDNGGAILEGYNELGGAIPSDIQNRTEYSAFLAANVPGSDPTITWADTDPKYKDYLIYRLRQVTEPSNNNNSHKLQPSETFFEMFSYWNAMAVQYSTSTGTANNFQSITPPAPGFDATIQSGSNYIAPSQFTDYECSNLYAIVMAMNSANQDDSLDTEIKNNMPADNAEKKFENMLDYMADHDLVTATAATESLITWVISDSGSVGATENWAAAGNSGDGLLTFEDAVQLEEDLTEAFTKIISVSSTFVASSVPVNVFNRIESLDNLFIALFEAQGGVDWPGNLKKLKLKDSITVDTDGDSVADATDGVFDQIVDVNQMEAFEKAGDDIGRIRIDALTFWTDPNNLPEPNTEKSEVADKDGRSVTRGGAGQIIPGFISDVIADSTITGARQLYVEPASGSTLDPFDADDATATSLQSLLGASSVAEAKTLIKWARGQDVDNIDGDSDTTDPRSRMIADVDEDGNSILTPRHWILGASIHSRPLALNYGLTTGYSSQSNPNIHLMMGSNDGIFHIFKNTTSGGAESGKEVFGFIPRELLDNISIMRANTQASSKMIYGVDGAPVPLVVDVNRDGTIGAGDEAYVYFGLRRGGKSYYALDVSDPDAIPTLKWKISNTDTNFTELGLTFSDPVVGKVRYGSSSVDVVIFAGGYNGGWDATFTNRIGKDLNDNDDTVGNAIYIVNARTGDLIWKAKQGTTGAVSNTVYQHVDMVDSIPSSVTPLDGNGNGVIDRLYVGDTGGAVWRVDLPEGDGSDTDHRQNKWFVTKFAELGTDGTTTDRRFFHAPDVVQTRDSSNYDGVLISTGNRADPLETNVENSLFLIKDRATTSGDASVKTRSTIVITDLPDVTDCEVQDGVSAACVVDKSTGWRITLEGSGEKGLSTPLVDAGEVIFTSYAPSSGLSACDLEEGDGAVYIVNLSDGSAARNGQRKYDLGPGIPSGPTAISGAIILPNGGIAEDSDGDDIMDDRNPVMIGSGKNLWLIHWREAGVDDLQ